MLKKAMITAAMGAAIVGGGTAALASSGSHPTSPSSSSTASTANSGGASTAKAKQAQKRHNRVQLGRALHGTWVTKAGKKATKGTFVTHDAIHGTVSAVTATSITVKAADGYSERFTVTSATKVRMRVTGQKKGNVSSIAQVKTGAKVIVLGTGKGTPTATRVVAGLKR